MDFFEKTISTDRIYDGKVINFRVDTVELPNGGVSKRELVEHPGGVGVVAVDGDGCLLLVEQFRKSYDKMICLLYTSYNSMENCTVAEG